MEFGPRALGHRSILADPRDPAMVQRINSLVKGREGFRPFAPAVLAGDAHDWFELDRPSPYMLFTVPVRSAGPVVDQDPAAGTFAERLGSVRSDLPACTHVDGSARVQTVDPVQSPVLAGLLAEFGRRTGCPVLLNTSFNRADEPVVRTPADALRCAAAAGLDLLVLERCLVDRDALAAVAAARSTF
jgi:carbamoyltransferase